VGLPTKKSANLYAFKVNPGQMAALMATMLQQECNPLSPYALGAVIPDGTVAEETKKMAQHPVFASVTAILAKPRLRTVYHKGGGVRQESFAVYSCAEGPTKGWVSLHDGGDATNLLLFFPDQESFLQWWVQRFAGDITQPAINAITPTLPLESLVVILHAIDCYRRSYYESMLSYEPDKGAIISEADFLRTLKTSLKSKDPRWLLASLFTLMSGFQGMTLNILPEHFSAAFELGFLVVDNQPAGSFYRFGEQGKILGQEFTVTWLWAVAWEAVGLTSEGVKSLSQAYLAPTAFANHLFFLLDGKPGTKDFSHHALDREELFLALTEWYQAVEKLAIGQLPPTSPRARSIEQIASTAQPSAAAIVCAVCRTELAATTKFCRKCGSKVAASLPLGDIFCKACGKQMLQGDKFCLSCGTENG
jgi:hypothetical protein